MLLNQKFKSIKKSLRENRTLLAQGGLIVVIILLFVIGSLVSPYFLKIKNFENIVRGLAVTGILALGQTIVILTGGIDLSVGGMLAFSSIIAALYSNGNMLNFFLISMCVGLFVGTINGIGVITKRIPPFIMTLTTLGITRGACLLLSKSMPIYFKIPGFIELSRKLILGIPLPGFVFLIIAIIEIFVLKYLPFGRELYAVGSNAEVARFSGLRVRRTFLFAYAISGLLAGVAAIVYSSYTSVAQPDSASGYELDAISMSVVGGTILTGGRGGVVGTLLGVIIMALLRNIFNLLNFQSPMQQILMGIALVIAVLAQSRPKK